MKIELTTEHPDSHDGRPIFLVDGEPVKDHEGLHALCKHLNWTQPVFAKATGVKLSTAKKWLSSSGVYPVPLYALRLAHYILLIEE
ncbi:hypothetical protein MLD52_09240 [Puniceicoccaceae bacterium K14]|nr:hypothetical protein [Puniceicoccaceae bacterium K14]